MAPENLLLGVVIAGLTLYAVLGGADFGAGVWEFNTAMLATPKERKLIYHAIGPVWEANHVWLIFVIVVLFSAFPPALAALSQALWIPLLLALVGIVFRGVGFVFRSYGEGDPRRQATWGAVFALASTAAPFFLGASVGAIAEGRLRVTANGDFEGDYLTDWLGPLPIYCGFMVVGQCAYLAAVFLTREASLERESELVELWRRRAIGVGLAMGVLAVVGLMVMVVDAPPLWAGFRARAWPLFGSSVATGLGSLAALVWRRYHIAVVGAASTVAAVVWGWLVAQYPLLVPPTISLESARAPDNVLWAFLIAIAAGTALLAPSLGLLFYLFKTHRLD